DPAAGDAQRADVGRATGIHDDRAGGRLRVDAAARVLTTAIQRRQGEGIGQVAGPAEDVVVAAAGGVQGAQRRAAADAQVARRALVVLGVRLAGVAERSQLERVVVGDVPVELDQALRGALVGGAGTGLEAIVDRDVLTLV